MKNIMTTAWEIAKNGAAKFGGSVKSYFAQALKMAWALSRKAATITVTLAPGSNKNKTYVAQITGTCTKWGLKREFVNSYEQTTEWSDKVFTLNEGAVYEIQAAGSRDLYIVQNGDLCYRSKQAVTAMFA